MKFKITITKEILAKSECGHPGRCAFTNALLDLFPFVMVSYTNAYVGTDLSTTETIPLTGSMKKFIKEFDKCNTLESKLALGERTFELDIPTSLLEMVVDISEITELLKTSNHLELV